MVKGEELQNNFFRLQERNASFIRPLQLKSILYEGVICFARKEATD